MKNRDGSFRFKNDGGGGDGDRGGGDGGGGVSESNGGGRDGEVAVTAVVRTVVATATGVTGSTATGVAVWRLRP